jgi:hypothetical protein
MKGSDLFHQRACREPFIGFHPSAANFFRDCLSREKAVEFGDHFVINTRFPPFPILSTTSRNISGRSGRLATGAGTAFYDALRPDSRPYMEERFKNELAKRAWRGAYNVVYDYIICTAQIDKESEANIE